MPQFTPWIGRILQRARFYVNSLKAVVLMTWRELQQLESINRELKQTDTAASNLQISIQKDSRPSEFSQPLTSITLNLNGICLLTTAASVCLSSLMMF